MSYISLNPSVQASKRIHRSYEDLPSIEAPSSELDGRVAAATLEALSEAFVKPQDTTVDQASKRIHRSYEDLAPIETPSIKLDDRVTDVALETISEAFVKPEDSTVEIVLSPRKIIEEMTKVRRAIFKLIIEFLKVAEQNTHEDRSTLFETLLHTFKIANSDLSEDALKIRFFCTYVTAAGVVLNSAYKKTLSDYMKEKYAYYDRGIVQETRFISKDSFTAKRSFEQIQIIDEYVTEESDIVESEYRRPVTKEYLRDEIRYKVIHENAKLSPFFLLDKPMRRPTYTFIFPDSKDPLYIEAFDTFVTKLKESIAIDFNLSIDDRICREYARNALNEVIRDHFKNQE